MLTRLPKEMYAEIARFLGQDFPGKGFRKAAGEVQIRDVRHGATYLNGRLHSFNDQPAAVYANGNQYWYQRGKPHRDNGPAVVYADGHMEWYNSGELHRDNGPAIIFASGTRIWYCNDIKHRDNGPAIIYSNGTAEYWLNGQRVEH